MSRDDVVNRGSDEVRKLEGTWLAAFRLHGPQT